MSTDVPWFVGGVEFDFHAGSAPEYTRGETVEINGVIESDISRYNQWQQRGEVADAAEYGMTELGNQPWFREQLPSDTNVSTIVYEVEPPDTNTTPAFWGILVGYSDNTTLPNIVARVNLELWVIAQVADYPSRADLDAQFSDTVIS